MNIAHTSCSEASGSKTKVRLTCFIVMFSNPDFPRPFEAEQGLTCSLSQFERCPRLDLGFQIGPFLEQSEAIFIVSMAELGEATVNRIKHEKSTCEKEEFLKELLSSRNNKEIIEYLRDSSKPNEDFQVTAKLV